jgi:D-3-phosphoglycerate dehydrogenase
MGFYTPAMKILIADKFEKSGIEGLQRLGCEVVNEPGAGAEGLGAALARHAPEVLIVRSSKVTGPVIAESRGLRAILRAGAGVDNIDVAAASAKGIGVSNCPGMNAVAVAELTMGLLLACDRRIAEQTAELRAGRWNKKEYAKARGLKGLTLGVVGLGAIGREVIERARAFGMQIIAWSRSLTENDARRLGVKFGGNDRAALLRMLGQCDAVSLHVALTPETKQMANAEFFAAMKPGAYLVNTSRGGVVDEAALREAAKGKGLRVGLDVYAEQPGTPEASFSCATAALSGAFTHHCGASTDQAQQAVADEIVRMVKVLKESGRLENCVNR